MKIPANKILDKNSQVCYGKEKGKTSHVQSCFHACRSRPSERASPMKLSTKGKYGVRAVFEIARNAGEGPITIKEIAARQGISFSYLEQILNRLRTAGLIESVRGPGGGYLLGKK